MRTELKKALASLHEVHMELQRLYDENLEELKKYSIKDDLNFADCASWKYSKCLDSIFHVKKLLGKIQNALPRVKKTRLDRTIEVTKKDLLRTLLNLISDRLEYLQDDENDVSIESLLELQEVLVKLKEDNVDASSSSTTTT